MKKQIMISAATALVVIFIYNKVPAVRSALGGV